MSGFNLDELPRIIKVRIIKTPEGNLIADLPEYENVFTQAESIEQLDFNINDLILAYFDVPKKYHKDIWYKPVKQVSSEAELIENTPIPFQILLSQHYFDPKWQ